ncbi:hypothetical protein [Actinoplanes derwentensis]|uniref:Uncharacterized protein n=1 Tax=Actinoplanes derwentensis TaxID=113562 RepID=A0A1H1TPS3_9ACTN|nr:hypothetical protein [Actinoplanes derwentensis]SDS61936.1 hypothetical protein SAMN04489716_1196 [Actinoplanes derwentensis]
MPDTGRVIEHLQRRTGAWETTAGKSDDSGALDVSISCIDGGHLTLTYTGKSPKAATASVPCQGSVTHNRDEALPPGPVDIAIIPDGTQKWSVLIVRGMQVEKE